MRLVDVMHTYYLGYVRSFFARREELFFALSPVNEGIEEADNALLILSRLPVSIKKVQTLLEQEKSGNW